MKTLIVAAGLFALTSAASAADVGVSINVGEPGFFGQIDIGSVPRPPQVIYAKPVVVERQVQYVGEPVYLRVPPGYERHWSRHCGEYHACGRPVYFVQDNWYRNEYVPHYREHIAHREEIRHEERVVRHEEHEEHVREEHGHEEHDRDHWHGRGHDEH